MNTDRKLITKKQSVAVLLLTAAAVLLIILTMPKTSSGAVAVITVKGDEIRRINLSEAPDETIALDNGVEIEIKDSAVGFVKSDCRDKICIDGGMLSKVGEQSACVPNGTVINIEGAQSDIDVISY